MAKQKIIFRFTIPGGVGNVMSYNTNLNDDFFVVSAFGQDYRVEYPSGIVGVRRPCAFKLGYIVLPTYYEEPKVEIISQQPQQEQQQPQDDDDTTNVHHHHHRYRVHVPMGIGPGEEFFLTLPHNGRQVRLIAPLNGDDNDSVGESKLNTTVLEFEVPDVPREQTLGYECRWKVLGRPKKVLQVTIPPLLNALPPPCSSSLPHCGSSSSLSGDSSSTFPHDYILTHIGTLPAILTSPSPIRNPKDQKDKEVNDDENNTNNNIINSSNNNNTVTFSVPLAHLPQRTNLPCQKGVPGWHRLYHVTDQLLNWAYLVLPEGAAEATSPTSCDSSSTTTTSSTATATMMVLSNDPPRAYCCSYGAETFQQGGCFRKPNAASLDFVPVMQSPGLSTVVTSMDRKTPRGTFQTIGTYWELIESLGERPRKERLSKWRFKLQREGVLVISLERRRRRMIEENVVEEVSPTTTEKEDPDTTSAATGSDDLLECVLEQVHAKLTSSPLLLRQSWEVKGQIPSSSSSSSSEWDWMVELTTRLVRQELRPIITTGPIITSNTARWEVHSESRLDCCRLLGILIGKSIIETKRPIFSRGRQEGDDGGGTNLARYLYKHILQWPIQREDLNEVSTTRYNDGAIAATGNIFDDAFLRDRLFDSIKPQLAALLDGMFTIVPRSFLFVFRSVEELEKCLVSD